MENVYDLIVLGAGPAGLSAGIYAGRAGLKTLILEKGLVGGQIINTSEIENYPGQVLSGETGESLTARMASQAESFGCLRQRAEIKEAFLEGGIKVLTSRKGKFMARAVIIATGAVPRPIGCRGESEFVGRGVSYCAVCDASFFKGMRTFVVGGGDSAVEEAVFLTRFARRVTIIHRRDSLRAAKSIQQKAFANPQIDFIWDSVVEEVGGGQRLEHIIVKNVKSGALTRIEKEAGEPGMGVFGFVGNVPATALFEGALDMDGGYIKTTERMETNVSGVFAAGDVRKTPLRQVVTAAADGAIAATWAEKYIAAMSDAN